MSETTSSPTNPPLAAPAAAARPAPAPETPAGPDDTVLTAGPNVGQKSIPGKRGIGVSDAAYGRLKTIIAERKTPEAGLRIAVKGGGCSGLSYSLNWDEKAREKDRVFARGQGEAMVKVFVDPKSYIYMVGTIVDFEDKVLQSGFKLTNPQQKSACGCGESFSV